MRTVKGDFITLDKQLKRLVVYGENGDRYKLKIDNEFDILAFRDFLNDAYPPDQIKRSKI
jgi:hypothetical protein